MSIYTLFGTQGSGSAAVEAALELAACEYRLVQASSWQTESAQAELRRHNPLMQIPTLLLPDGSVMTESAAILMHLGLSVPDSGLLPHDPAARAQMLRGLVFIAANCYSAISISDYPERWTTSTDKSAIEALRQGTRAQLHRHWEIFADQFPAHPFLSGEAPGALDLLAAVVSKWSGTRPHLRAHRPAFYETLLAIEQQASVAGVFTRHWP